MNEYKIKLYCPFCTVFLKEILLDKLLNGVTVSCNICDQSVYIGEHYWKIKDGKKISGYDLLDATE